MSDQGTIASAKAPGANCAHCPCRNAKLVAPRWVDTPNRVRLMVVGEAPGKSELASNEPFAGRAGALLARGLKTIGLQRSDVHWTNAVLCDAKEYELKAARKCCEPRLQREIHEARPEAILPVGAYGLQSSLALPKKPRISDWRGSVTADLLPSGERFYVLPTLHPGFVLKVPLWGEVLEDDIARVGRVLRQGWEAPEDRKRVRVLRTLSDLAWLDELGDTVSFDVETVGLGPTKTKLVCFALADQKQALVVPWAQQNGEHNHWNGHRWEVANVVRARLARRTLRTHNGYAFDHIVGERYGLLDLSVQRCEDTLIAFHALRSHQPKRLSHVATRFCDVPPWKQYENNKDLASLHSYNGRDVLYTDDTAEGIFSSPDFGPDERRVYEQDKKCAALGRQMQINGFGFDKARAVEFVSKLEQAEAEAQREANEIAGREIKLLSPKDMRRLFFDEWRAPIFFVSEKSHQPSLGVDAMRGYSMVADERVSCMALLTLRYRRIRKVRSTYLTRVIAELGDDGRVHPTWMNYGAVSGRWSCQGPNLMNLPRAANDPTAEWGGIRSVYCAAQGYVLVSFDAKQIEMRMAAYCSKDPRMIAACEGSDLHSANAAIIFGERFTRLPQKGEHSKGCECQGCQAFEKLRNLAKTSGFAVAYSATAPTVHARLVADGQDIKLETVESMLLALHRAFKVYYRWQAEQFEQIVEQQYVQSPILRRKRWLGPEPKATEAANFPIQAGAADLMNLRLPEIADAIRPLGAKAVAQVHDAGVFEVPEARVSEAQQIMQEIFERPIEIFGVERSFPLDFKVGERWS